MNSNNYINIMKHLESRQKKLHNYCARYQYDVLYYKYGKYNANKIMEPNNNKCHLTYRQQYFVYHIQNTEPVTYNYATAKMMLKKYSDELRYLKMFLIPEYSKRRLDI